MVSFTSFGHLLGLDAVRVTVPPLLMAVLGLPLKVAPLFDPNARVAGSVAPVMSPLHVPS
jgi:hypothetical protein